MDVPANAVLQLCPGETTAQRVPGLVEANPGDRRPDAERAPVTVHRQLADRGYVDLRSAAERLRPRVAGIRGGEAGAARPLWDEQRHERREILRGGARWQRLVGLARKHDEPIAVVTV